MKTNASAKTPEAMNPLLEAYYSDKGLMWRNLLLILLLNIGWATVGKVIGPLVILRLNSVGVHEGGLGWMHAVNFWVYSYAVMYFAWKSDHTVSRFGRRIPYLFISAPVIIGVVLVFPFISIPWILVGLSLIKMFFTDIKAATIPLLNIDCMPRRILAQSHVPGAIAMAVMSFVAVRYGTRLSEWSEPVPYLIGGAVMIATTLIGGLGIKEPPVHKPTREKFRPWSAMKVAWRDKRAIVLMCAVSLLQTFTVCFNAWIWLYAKNELHMTVAQTGVAMSWSLLVGIIVAYPIGWLTDKYSPYRLMPFLCLAAGGALWCLMHASGTWVLVMAACLAAICASLYGSADIMVYRNADPHEVGSVTSTNSCLRGFYNGCTGLLYGYLIEKSGGHYEYAFMVAFGLTVLGLVPLYTYRRMMQMPSGRGETAPAPTPVSAG